MNINFMTLALKCKQALKKTLFALQTEVSRASAHLPKILFKNYGHKKIQPYKDSFLLTGKQEAIWYSRRFIKAATNGFLEQEHVLFLE